MEFRGNLESALGAYRQHVSDPSPAVRAGAWMRIARIHWRNQQWDESLSAFDRLAAIRNVGVEGLPADFVARRAKCSVLEEAGRKLELAREAEHLR
jgi:hypothetical protein